jgi:hypothetical protein
MNLTLATGVLIGIGVGMWVAYLHVFGIQQIEYRGETFRLSKRYLSYESYRNDPRNIDPSEIARIEKIITAAHVRTSFPDWASFSNETFPLKFPGFAIGAVGAKTEPVERKLLAQFIEIPLSGKNRYFLLEEAPDRSLRVLDDFVASDQPRINRIRLGEREVVYFDNQDRVIREKAL